MTLTCVICSVDLCDCNHTVACSIGLCDIAQCLEEGVLLLESMLATRKPQSVPDEIGPEDSLRLIQQGLLLSV